MSYNYYRTKTAYFNIKNVSVEIDVDLAPEKLSWGAGGKVVMTGKAGIVLPNKKYTSEPYELEVSEDGTYSKCSCSDPVQEHLIAIAAKNRKRELAELIKDEKESGSLKKKP